MTLPAVLQRWSDDHERWGLTRFLHIRLMRAVGRWLTICRVQVRRLDAESPVPTPPPGFEVRTATAAELDRACEQRELKLSKVWVHDALARGDLCVATFQGKDMVAYLWRSFGSAPHLHGLWVHFEKPYRYGYNAFTLPAFRGRHLAGCMSRYLDRYSVEHGVTHSIGFIESHNYPSITSDRRMGGTLVGWAGYVRLCGRVLPFRSPGARRHRFAFFLPQADRPGQT